MKTTFDIIPSGKIGFSSKENYIVTRGGEVFLRIIGDYPLWTVMTATASEDNNLIRICSDHLRLIKSAVSFCVDFKTDPVEMMDWMGRKYVVLFKIEQEAGESDVEFKDFLRNVISDFFEIYENK